MLDTIYRVETPEGVHVHLRVAGPTARALALVIDLLIRGFAYMLGMLALNPLGNTGIGIGLILLFLTEWFYPVFFEIYRKGQTPGKRLFKLRVVQENGSDVGWQSSLLRNLLRVADFLPFCYGFGLISVLVSGNFQRLGDLAAGTLVVYHNLVRRKASEIPAVPPRAPRMALLLEEQRAVVSLVERAGELGPKRMSELAGIAAPVVGADGSQSLDTLFQTANWLVGKRP